MKNKRKRAFFTFRYFKRPSGTLTASCAVFHTSPTDKSKEMLVGFSFCVPEDQFSRKEGSKLAVSRMIKDPLHLKADCGISKTLLEYLRESSPDVVIEKFGAAPYTHRNGNRGDFDLLFRAFLKEV